MLLPLVGIVVLPVCCRWAAVVLLSDGEAGWLRNSSNPLLFVAWRPASRPLLVQWCRDLGCGLCRVKRIEEVGSSRIVLQLLTANERRELQAAMP